MRVTEPRLDVVPQERLLEGPKVTDHVAHGLAHDAGALVVVVQVLHVGIVAVVAVAVAVPVLAPPPVLLVGAAARAALEAAAAALPAAHLAQVGALLVQPLLEVA